MTFEWDEANSQWTKENRGFDFEYAATVFLDPERLESIGYERGGEIRYYTVDKAVFGESYSSCLRGDNMRKNKSVASSRPGSLTRKSEKDIKAYANSPAAQQASARLREHMRLRGPEPSKEDLAENPVLTDEELGRMYRPIKISVTVRLDADVLAWLRSKGGAYQTRMNELLREIMERELRRGR